MTIDRPCLEDRLTALVAAIPPGGATIRALGELGQYAHLERCRSRQDAAKNDLGFLLVEGTIVSDHRGTGTPTRYRLAGDVDPPTVPPPLESYCDLIAVPTWEPTEAWTLDEVLYWLATSEEVPADGRMASAFERNRRKATAGVMAAMDERDRRRKGEL